MKTIASEHCVLINLLFLIIHYEKLEMLDRRDAPTPAEVRDSYELCEDWLIFYSNFEFEYFDNEKSKRTQ